MHDALSSDVFN